MKISVFIKIGEMKSTMTSTMMRMMVMFSPTREALSS